MSAGKGSADTRTPDRKAREEAWERIWGKAPEARIRDTEDGIQGKTRCPTCQQRDSRPRVHEMDDGTTSYWFCNVAGCANAPAHRESGEADGCDFNPEKGN
jgi:hypothetical protein